MRPGNCSRQERVWLSGKRARPAILGLQIQLLSDDTLYRGPITIVKDRLLTKTYSDKAGDYLVPNVLVQGTYSDLTYRK